MLPEEPVCSRSSAQMTAAPSGGHRRAQRTILAEGAVLRHGPVFDLRYRGRAAAAWLRLTSMRANLRLLLDQATTRSPARHDLGWLAA